MNSSSGISGIYSNLSELSSIRSGSYYKLAKKYYGNSASSSSEASDSKASERVSRTEYDYKNRDYKINIQSTATSKDSASTIAGTEKSAESLKDSVAALNRRGKDSVFTQADGAYDNDKIYSAVSAFAKDYNSVVSAASKSDSSSISNAASSMVNTTKVNSKLLSQVGITVGSDNKLYVDEEIFNNADMSKVQTLFNGNGSYGYQVGVSASMIDAAAQLEASKANTYTASGSYSYNFNAGDLYNMSV